MRNALAALVLAAIAPAAFAQACPHRGELDDLYCDADRNLLADPPSDPKKLKNPSTLVFTYTPIEDPAVYQNIFKDFLEGLVGRVKRGLEAEARDRIVKRVSYLFALFILALVLWQFIGPRI